MKAYKEKELTKLGILDYCSNFKCQIQKEKVNGGLQL